MNRRRRPAALPGSTIGSRFHSGVHRRTGVRHPILVRVMLLSLLIGPQVWAADWRITNDAYLEFHSGTTQGAESIEIHPHWVPGFKTRVQSDYLDAALNVYGLFGDAKTGDGTVHNRFFEIDGSESILYPVVDRPDFAFGAGLYGEFSVPLEHYRSVVDFQHLDTTAPGESEVSEQHFNLGLDIRASGGSDRLRSTIDGVLYFAGTRVGPNLIPYSPLASIAWQSRLFLIGTATAPRLNLFVDGTFWMARKFGDKIFTAHDGLAGSKREFAFKIGLEGYIRPDLKLYLMAYGDNNLNRGTSTTVPTNFRDGYYLGIAYRF